jgi:hypothetical protein
MKDQSLIEEKFPQFLRLVQNANGWIHVSTLCEILDLPSSQVRILRAHGQLLGHAIASSNKGYSYDPDEMKATSENYMSRAIRLLVLAYKIKRFDRNQLHLELENKLEECHAS